MPADPATTQFADSITVATALDALARSHPDLPELSILTFTTDGATGTPWLFCRPINALLRWVKVLPRPVEVTPVSLGADGTRLVATSRLDGVPLTLHVVTHLTGIAPTSSSGRINRSELARLATGEAGAPDLSQQLDMEMIRAPHAPMPPMETASPVAGPAS